MSSFSYKESLDAKLKKAVATSLKIKVSNVSRIEQGEVNFAYRVETNNGLFHARIFRYEGWPEKGKLKWISEKLDVAKVPQSKIVYIDEESAVFPYGFMISEWIDGKNGWSAIKDRDISFGSFYQNLARLLKKVHATRASHYGFLTGDGFSDYVEFQVNFINDPRIKKLVAERKIQQQLLTRYQKKIESLLQDIVAPPSVLVHGDPTPDNVIWSIDRLVLIDWDDAIADTWVRDFAYLTYYSDKPKKLTNEFLKGYGKISLSKPHLQRIERATHLRIALNLLPYYVFDNPNSDRFSWNKKRLDKYLSQSLT